MTKEAAGGRLPRPPDVEADFTQGLEGGGKSGDYIIGLEVRHCGNGLTVAVLSRKGKKVSSARWQRVTCRGGQGAERQGRNAERPTSNPERRTPRIQNRGSRIGIFSRLPAPRSLL